VFEVVDEIIGWTMNLFVEVENDFVSDFGDRVDGVVFLFYCHSHEFDCAHCV
jgi:hypothetical protein